MLGDLICVDETASLVPSNRIVPLSGMLVPFGTITLYRNVFTGVGDCPIGPVGPVGPV
jgi:hypothetical protein